MTLSGLICGTSALPRGEEEDCEHERKTRSADSSPRKSRPKSGHGHGHGHGHNNPYSDRGLDRFSALLSEIEEKRQKIYSQVDDPNEISLVRFVYKAEDHEFKPIIVKAKPPPITEQQQQPSKKQPQKTVPSRKFSSFSSSLSPSMATKEVKPEITTTTTKNTRVKWEYYYYPKIYLTIIVIMIMVFLLVFGKSFAIMCTSIGWYVIPHAMSTTTNSSRSLKPNTTKSKEFVRAKLNVEKKQNKAVVLEGTKSFKHPRERVFGCQRTT